MEHHDELIKKLREKGYRLTPQRVMVLEAIEHNPDHISAEEIYSRVAAKYPDVNISTVYRTLELLTKLGLVTETDLGGGRVRYHPADKGHHHHLVCRDCGAIIDLDEAALAGLKETLLRDYGFIADLRHLGIWGRCVRCQQKVAHEDKRA